MQCGCGWRKLSNLVFGRRQRQSTVRMILNAILRKRAARRLSAKAPPFGRGLVRRILAPRCTYQSGSVWNWFLKVIDVRGNFPGNDGFCRSVSFERAVWERNDENRMHPNNCAIDNSVAHTCCRGNGNTFTHTGKFLRWKIRKTIIESDRRWM